MDAHFWIGYYLGFQTVVTIMCVISLVDRFRNLAAPPETK